MRAAGEFPRGAPSEPFLSDDDRRAIASASGLMLPVREDRLDRERYLFYVCASRAERLLVLSSRSSDEEGNPEAESFFVDDVRELFTSPPELRDRSLADVTWSPSRHPPPRRGPAPAAAGPPRGTPPGPLSSAPLLAERLGLREPCPRRRSSASPTVRSSGSWRACSTRRSWRPIPSRWCAGRYAHSVLEHTFQRLREETGERRASRTNLARAERILLEELHERRADFQLSPKETRVRAAARRFEFDLPRYLLLGSRLRQRLRA